MPNAIAYAALLIWPFVSLIMFRRMPVERALVWSIVGAYMFLPPIAEFDLPLVPDFDKFSIPNLTAAFIIYVILKHPMELIPNTLIGRILIAGFLASVIPTVLNNGEPIILGRNSLPGLRLIDVLSVLSTQLIVILPFLLARQFLATEKALRELLKCLMVAGLIYSIPALIEIRMSPQLNIQIYGFFQHSFAQMMRDGGFRPIVFMPHALWLSLFFLCATAAAAALSRGLPREDRGRFVLASAYLFVVLYLTKSLASFAYSLALLPLIYVANARMILRVSLGFAAVAVIYPMLRNFELVPLEWILEQAYSVNETRGGSLEYRFDNEELLLERAAEKTWFGWGVWGRNLLHDFDTGQIVTVPDGRWIITFGKFGWVGYISEMALLALPIFLLMHYNKRDRVGIVAATAALLLAITMVDMLINDTLVPFTWMIAGAILGRAEALAKVPTAKVQRPFPEGPAIGRERPERRRSIM